LTRAHQGFGWVGEWANVGLVIHQQVLIPLSPFINLLNSHQQYSITYTLFLQERHEQEIRFPEQHRPHPDAASRRQGEDRAVHPRAGGTAPSSGGPGEEPRLREQINQARAVPIQQGAGPATGDQAHHISREQWHRPEPVVGLRARGPRPPELQEDELREEPELRAPARQRGQGAPELGLVPEPGQLAGEGVRQEPGAGP